MPNNAPATDGALVTTINPKWRMKMYVYSAVLLALGAWGLWDALVKYPERGARAAEYFEFQHLDLLKSQGKLGNNQATISEPETLRARLAGEKASSGGKLSDSDSVQLSWLTQLKLIGKNTLANTSFPRTDFRKDAGAPVQVASADERHAQLKAIWTVAKDGKVPSPNPLSWWDIPSQWLFVVVGLGGAAYIASLLARVGAKKFRFQRESNALTLPGGETIRPEDIKEFDKSKWDKLYINLHIRPDHPQLPAKNLELDLLRYVPLEEWVLAMEAAKQSGMPTQDG